MQAPFELNEGLRRLRAIIASFPPESEHWNEAQNRFQFVDRFLTECLGWQKPDISVEVSDADGGKADYLLGRNRAVLEAKKEAKHFGDLPFGNTRAVIELITGFCGSPNVDSRKIVEIEQAQGHYDVPLHEFTKHALLGEYAYFNSQSSLVACNVFDISLADPREHFLASLIIAYLSSNTGVRDNDGFIGGARIMSEMAGFGYVPEQVQHQMRRLAAKKLIETPHAHYREVLVDPEELPDQFFYRATSVGMYHIRHWSGAFPFLDATSTDTPIFDSTTRGLVFDLAGSFDIADRYKKAEAFRRYLEAQWTLANINSSYFDFRSLLQAQNDSFASVERFVTRGPRPRW